MADIQHDSAPPDFRALFEEGPGCYLVLSPDLRIVAVSEGYLSATRTVREQIVGRGVFEVLPDNPDDPTASGVPNTRASFERVIAEGVSDSMPVQRHDIRRSDGEFETRYWSPINTPIFGVDPMSSTGQLAWIIHRVEDVTEFVRLKQAETASDQQTAELRGNAERMEAEVLARSWEVAAASRQLKAVNAQVMAAVEVMLDGFGVHSAVRAEEGDLVDFTWDYVNPAGAGTYGLKPADFVGRTMLELAPAIRESGLFDDYRRVVETGEPLAKEEFVYRDIEAGGTIEGVFAIQAVKVGDGLVISWRDISARKQQERALAEAKDRFQSAFDGAPIGVALVDLDGRLEQVNGPLCRLLGYDVPDLVGKNILDFTHPDDIADRARLLAQLRNATIDSYSIDIRYVHAEGHSIWARIHSSVVRHVTGRPHYTINHVEDVSESKRVQDQLAHQAMHDPLTGLANRHLLVARLQHCLDEVDRTDTAVAVLYLDLDGFKTVNDSVGHDAGDRFLAEVGRRLASVVRRHDTAARIGGDEFVIVAARLSADHKVARVIDRIRAALQPPIVIDADTFTVSASIGVVVTRDAADDPSELLRAADTAMYRAKQGGRGRHDIFDAALRAEAMRRREIEHDLRHALETGRLRLYYQPVVNLADGQMAGVEALLRLDHPTRGLLGPADFLDVAEDTGLIIPIGAWVITEACRQQAAWQASLGRPLQMAVNLSGRQLLQADLCDHVSAAIDHAAIDPARLTLELTETVFTQASRSFLTDLAALKARGVRFALDDFGTGFSSLAYLEQFPVDVVKIGPTFVAGLGKSTQDATLVTAIVNLGHTLHLTVVAEGVESPDQLAALQDMGCDLVQGFHFAVPSPADQIPGLLAAIRHPPSAIRQPGAQDRRQALTRPPDGAKGAAGEDLWPLGR